MALEEFRGPEGEKETLGASPLPGTTRTRLISLNPEVHGAPAPKSTVSPATVWQVTQISRPVS